MSSNKNTLFISPGCLGQVSSKQKSWKDFEEKEMETVNLTNSHSWEGFNS